MSPEKPTGSSGEGKTSTPNFERFGDALEGAELLLDFAARNGLQNEKFKEEEFSSAALRIAGTREKYKKNSLTPEDQSKLYEIYWQLAQLMRPVSVDSIRDSSPSLGEKKRRYLFFGPNDWMSFADLAVRRWRRNAVAVLIVLLVVQIYWVTGAALIHSLQLMDVGNEASNTTPAPTPSQITAEQKKIITDVRRSTLDELLASWWHYFPLPSRVKELPQKTGNDEFALTKWASSLMERCSQGVNVLQVYILPLLYGLLGAHAYVLRELIRENREHIYHRESETAYRMRIILGLLAGLAIGWFLRPDPTSAGIVAKLGPFALSFLAGYSVEVLFSAMDRFVAAFGSISQQSKS